MDIHNLIGLAGAFDEVLTDERLIKDEFSVVEKAFESVETLEHICTMIEEHGISQATMEMIDVSGELLSVEGMPSYESLGNIPVDGTVAVEAIQDTIRLALKKVYEFLQKLFEKIKEFAVKVVEIFRSKSKIAAETNDRLEKDKEKIDSGFAKINKDMTDISKKLDEATKGKKGSSGDTDKSIKELEEAVGKLMEMRDEFPVPATISTLTVAKKVAALPKLCSDCSLFVGKYLNQLDLTKGEVDEKFGENLSNYPAFKKLQDGIRESFGGAELIIMEVGKGQSKLDFKTKMKAGEVTVMKFAATDYNTAEGLIKLTSIGEEAVVAASTLANEAKSTVVLSKNKTDQITSAFNRSTAGKGEVDQNQLTAKYRGDIAYVASLQKLMTAFGSTATKVANHLFRDSISTVRKAENMVNTLQRVEATIR